MVKKKRQSDPGENGDESTESCDENVKSTCPHVTKALDFPRLKKSLKVSGFEKDCTECVKNGINDVESGYEENLTLWMCLRCGSQLCGRARNKHALNHYNTPHSDCHALTVNTTTWEIYCYNCNNEVTTSSSKKLHECVEYLKKQVVGNGNKTLPPIELPPPTETIIKMESPLIKTKDKTLQWNVSRVRGLTNLGNTCFFNSVVQCLVQTPYLLQVLEEMAMPGERFTLPGGKMQLKGENDDEEMEVDLPPIAGELSEWGSITRALAETLSELQAGEGGVYTPRKLLSSLVNKLPQFGGGDQHDAHELLRHLLEAVRSEDLRRYQSVILNNLGMNSKVDPAKVCGEVKQRVKFYGQQASDTMLRPEQVFRGFLVSTLECQDCLHQSDRVEYFLDLSLPVAASRPQPPAVVRRKNPNGNHSTNTTPTKDEASGDAAKTSKEDGKSSTESDADVEDNLDDAPKQTENHTTSDGSQTIAHTAANFATYHMESGYNSEKVISSDSIRTSPVDLDKEKSDNTPEHTDKDKIDSVDTYTSTAVIPLDVYCKEMAAVSSLISLDNMSNPDSGVVSPEGTKHNSTETFDNVDSPVNSKELNDNVLTSNDLELDNKYLVEERPVSRISFAPSYTNDVVSRGISVQGSKNLLENSRDSSYESLTNAKPQNLVLKNLENHQVTSKLDELDLDIADIEVKKPPYPSPVAAPDAPPPAPRPKLNDTDKNTRDFLPYPRPNLLSPRYVCDEDDCSIQSCLSQFTALELLTGNNKVGCETCTKRINGKDGKTVYTNATKRFLVSSPPAILILHLKRFQLGPRCLFRKMSKHVEFQTILDLAPFCAMDKLKKLPNVALGQTELLYSLYGIVEHSGVMHGGHYVAYVKVRDPVKPGDPRWWFLPKSANIPPTNNGDGDNESESDLSGYESGESPSPSVEVPQGKWYYVSDSMVSEVSEEKVLRAQAYLLFYERIL